MKMGVEYILPSSVDLKGTFLVGIISVKRCPPLPNAVLWCNNRPRVKTPRSFSRRRCCIKYLPHLPVILMLWVPSKFYVEASWNGSIKICFAIHIKNYIGNSEIHILNTVELILEEKIAGLSLESSKAESFQSRTITIRCRQTALSHPGPSQLWCRAWLETILWLFPVFFVNYPPVNLSTLSKVLRFCFFRGSFLFILQRASKSLLIGIRLSPFLLSLPPFISTVVFYTSSRPEIHPILQSTYSTTLLHPSVDG